MNEVEKSKEILKDIESSLARMHDITSANPAIIHILDKHWTAIKGAFIGLLLVLALLGGFGGAVYYHFTLDEHRFTSTAKQVEIMENKLEFLVSWQKSMQEQMIHLHSEDIRGTKK